jgi:hypothetical protein
MVRPMKLLLAIPLCIALVSHAPLQCGSKPDPELRREDTAGDGLWALAERFKSEGNSAARKSTLRFLAEQYPSHRYAQVARDEACQPPEKACLPPEKRYEPPLRSTASASAEPSSAPR